MESRRFVKKPHIDSDKPNETYILTLRSIKNVENGLKNINNET